MHLHIMHYRNFIMPPPSKAFYSTDHVLCNIHSFLSTNAPEVQQ